MALGEITAGGLQDKERAEVNVGMMSPQEQAQQPLAGLQARALSPGGTHWVTKTVPYHHTKIRTNCSCTSPFMAAAEETEHAQPVVGETLHIPHSGKVSACSQGHHSSLTALLASIHTPLSSCFTACPRIVEGPQRVSKFSEYFGVFWLAKSPMAASVPNRSTSPAEEPEFSVGWVPLESRVSIY